MEFIIKKKKKLMISAWVCSMWSERSTLHINIVRDWLFVFVLMLLPIQIERTVFLGGEPMHRLLYPLLLRGMCFVSRV